MNILFMCVANSARSQIAEGLARKILPEASIYSAGSHPSALNPAATTVMKEIGIDISTHFSKSYDQLPAGFRDDLDFVITLCAEEVCPVISSQKAKRLHWPFPDPASKEKIPEELLLQRFREAREAIQNRLLKFKRELFV